MLEHPLELPGTAEESLFFEEGCKAEQLTLLPPQRATCPACDASDAKTRRARLFHRVGTQFSPTPAVGPRDFPLPEAGVRVATEWKSVRSSTPTGTYIWALLSRGEASEMRRHRTSYTK